jgi:FkbM family methyltransferase
MWRGYGQLTPTIRFATKQGRYTVFTSDRAIGRTLYLNREYERRAMKEVVDLLHDLGMSPEAGTLVDIGANIGVIAIAMLEAGHVRNAIAIEPEPKNYALLLRNVADNELSDRVRCLQCAVSDRTDRVEFELSPSNFGDHRVRGSSSDAARARYAEHAREVISVPADTLDHLITELPGSGETAISLVWMDVQGHELSVLRGGEQTFATRVPLVTEFWPYGMRRSGASCDEFLRVASQYWTGFWIRGAKGFERRTMDALPPLFERLAAGTDHTTLVFAD